MRTAIALTLAVSAAAQEPGFEVQSRLVLVPVTVNDSKGRAVEDLQPEEFRLLDNGRPQKITVDTFATGVAPIALITAVQSSGISAAALDKVRKIGSMIHPLITGERGCAGLISFDNRVTSLQECTKSADSLALAFSKLRPGDQKSGRMLDAAHEAIRQLRARTGVRRVLLLISESRDRGSETALEDVAIDAQAAGVAIYSATYSAFRTAFTTKPGAGQSQPPVQKEPIPPKAPRQSPDYSNIPVPPPEQRMDILGGIGELVRLGKTNDTQELARATGGAIFSFERQKGLENAIEKLGQELHTQYLLSFVPEQTSPGEHRLEIEVLRKGKLNTRSRPAYWAAQ